MPESASVSHSPGAATRHVGATRSEMERGRPRFSRATGTSEWPAELVLGWITAAILVALHRGQPGIRELVVLERRAAVAADVGLEHLPRALLVLVAGDEARDERRRRLAPVELAIHRPVCAELPDRGVPRLLRDDQHT